MDIVCTLCFVSMEVVGNLPLPDCSTHWVERSQEGVETNPKDYSRVVSHGNWIESMFCVR